AGDEQLVFGFGREAGSAVLPLKWVVHHQPHLTHHKSCDRRSDPEERDGHVAVLEIPFFESLMALRDPFLFVRQGDVGTDATLAPMASA
ncbi:hypothetical protein LTR48_007650, partial [Friedmanniomyces endolithicus]